MKDVFIFSGTTEGRSLARYLASRGVPVHVSVATEYGADVMEADGDIDVRVGSCGGTEGIADIIIEKGYGIVVDATHPYATRISKHIREACGCTGARYVRVRRDDSSMACDDDLIEVGSLEEAMDYLSNKDGRVFATTGSNDINLYTRLDGYRERVVARVLSTVSSVERCAAFGFSGPNLICGQGPFSEESTYAALKDCGAKYMVTKDSGDVGGFNDKVRAARRAGVTTIVVKKPEDPGVPYSEAVHLLDDLLGLDHVESTDVPMERRTVTLIGIGVGRDCMTVRASDAVASADVLIGARRMLESVEVRGRPTLVEYKPSEVVSFLDSNPSYSSAVILMSGDVGFYSGAKKLLQALDRSRYDVRVECGISSLVYLASRMETSWQDAHLVSAHGREANLVGLSRIHGKLFTLLSGEESVHSMCRDLIEYGMDVNVTVGQDLGYPTEKLVSGTPEEVLREGFGDLCVAMIENPNPDRRNPISIPDEEFVRGDAPMTKSEVRALSVAKLKLDDDSVVYDVGAGTGSVSVEIALCAVNGKVYAIEREDVAADLIEVNKLKFKVPNLEVVRGLAPEAMADLPKPTHAFIGGSAGNLKDIIRCLLDKNPDVRIVINSVTLETLAETTEAISELGLIEEEIVNLNVSKARKLGKYHLMTAQNPIYIAVVRGK